MTASLLLVNAVIAYLAATLVLALSLFRRVPLPSLAWATPAAIALLLHGSLLYIVLSQPGALQLSFFTALSLVAWIVALLHVAVSMLRPVHSLGIVVLPIAAALAILAQVTLSPVSSGSDPSWQIRLHMVFALLAYSTLSVAAAQALMLALQEHALRRRRLLLLMRAFPPLTLMEHLLFQLITAGFVLLSLTLLSGVLFVQDLFAQHLVHKTTLSFAAWLVFGTVLWGRWRYGWRGRRAVRLTLAGMMVLLLAYFGSKFVLEIILQRSA